MKILFKKQQRDIEKRIYTVLIALNKHNVDIDLLNLCIDHFVEIVYKTSGEKGLNNISYKLKKNNGLSKEKRNEESI